MWIKAQSTPFDLILPVVHPQWSLFTTIRSYPSSVSIPTNSCFAFSIQMGISRLEPWSIDRTATTSATSEERTTRLKKLHIVPLPQTNAN